MKAERVEGADRLTADTQQMAAADARFGAGCHNWRRSPIVESSIVD
jgi:hypothetical protein